ncbi:MAG: PLP-dependent aminotransferase family protein [Sporomusaceae bacterium]|nr:PLP-dependent aminotransferase family protein [Sporomusaceae bacterium]
MYTLALDRMAKLPLIRQLYNEIRQRILDGRLPEYENLPATRKLAAHYRISRNVVMEAYDLLRTEGFVASRQGGYTFVAPGARLTSLPPSQSPALPSLLPTVGVIDFRHGLPALDLFPRAAWQKTVARTMASVPDHTLGYGDAAGCPELRTALAAYLAKTRGVSCSPDQVVVTAGATPALALIARLLLTANRKVIIGDPVNQDVFRYLGTLGCELAPVPLDAHGLQTELLSGHAANPPAFTLVTPSHQFPVGGLLPVQRRIQLINFARSTGSYIVEDDYENEYAYEGNPVSSLQGLAPEKVAYVGTFSKTLAPFLRLGYIVLPPGLLAAFHEEAWFATHQPSAVCQLALAAFIGTGQLRRHIAKMVKAYQARRAVVVRELGRRFGDTCRILSGPAGLHLTVAFDGVNFSPAVLDHLERHGVRVYAVRQHVVARDGDAFADQLILGYGSLSAEEIAVGIDRLSQAIAALP